MRGVEPAGARDLVPQNSRNPSRCQRRTVSGFTTSIASRKRGMRLASSTRSPGSRGANSGFFSVLATTINCRRRAMFSARRSFGERVTCRSSPPTSETGRVVVRRPASTRSAILPTTPRIRTMTAASTACIFTTSRRPSGLVCVGFLNEPEAEEASSHHTPVPGPSSRGATTAPVTRRARRGAARRRRA